MTTTMPSSLSGTIPLLPHLPSTTPSSPIPIAHRGNSTTHPENTLSAFRAAVEAGATAIETDLRLSRDGVVVLAHDATYGRCFSAPSSDDDRNDNGDNGDDEGDDGDGGNGSGNSQLKREKGGKEEEKEKEVVMGHVAAREWDELAQLRSKRRQVGMHAGEPMARFEDLLEFMAEEERAGRGMWAMLDIKMDDDTTELLTQIRTTIVAAPQSTDWKSRLVLAFWTHSGMRAASTILPGYTISYTCRCARAALSAVRHTTTTTNTTTDTETTMRSTTTTRVEKFPPEFRMLNMPCSVLTGPLGRRLLRAARERGFYVTAWTAHSHAWMRWCAKNLDPGYAGVICNDVGEYRRVCAEVEAEAEAAAAAAAAAATGSKTKKTNKKTKTKTTNRGIYAESMFMQTAMMTLMAGTKLVGGSYDGAVTALMRRWQAKAQAAVAAAENKAASADQEGH